MDKINNFDKKIKFSVVTACFNARETIAETILSVRNQDYPNYEHIIIDGGSLDGTLDIIKKYAASDSRISFVS